MFNLVFLFAIFMSCLTNGKFLEAFPSESSNFQCYVFSQNVPIQSYGRSSVSIKQCSRSQPGRTFCVATLTKMSNGEFSFIADQSDQCSTNPNECMNSIYITQSSTTFKYCCNTSLCNSLAIAQLSNNTQSTNMTVPEKMCEKNIPISTLRMAIPLATNATNVKKCYSCFYCDVSDIGYIQNCGSSDHHMFTREYETSDNYTTKNPFINSANYFCSYKYTYSFGREKWSGGCENIGYEYARTSSLYYNVYTTSYYQDVYCGSDLCNNPLNYQSSNGLVLCEDGFYVSNRTHMQTTLQCNSYSASSHSNYSFEIVNNTCLFNSKPSCAATITKYFGGFYAYGSAQCSNDCLNDATVSIHSATFNMCCNTTNCNSLSQILRTSSSKQCQNNMPIGNLRRLIVPLPSTSRTVTRCFSCANCNMRNTGSIVTCENNEYSKSYCQYRYINLRGAEFWYGSCGSSFASTFYSTSINDLNIIQKDFTCDTDLCNNPTLYPFASTYVLCEDGFYTNQTWTTTTTRSTSRTASASIRFNLTETTTLPTRTRPNPSETASASIRFNLTETTTLPSRTRPNPTETTTRSAIASRKNSQTTKN